MDANDLTILLYPAEVLSVVAKPITEVDASIRTLADRMLALMHEADGVGLAAPQVGVSVRLFVTRDPQEACDGIIWVNPTIEVIDDTIASDIEGCLSLPEIDVTVRRPVGVRICGHDLDGNVIEEESSEHIARVWQHEYDHLDGRLITDRMSTMDRIRSRRALRTLLQRDS